MLLMVVCGALLLAGVAVAVIWSREPLIEPLPAGERPRRAALGQYARWGALLTIAGTATGVLIVGAGGRLAMRLLAATSPGASGRLTEGDAVVGDITLEGTLAFAAFGALPLAFLSAALYLLVAPWLPPGRLKGPALGLMLLVVASSSVDPLRADNRDFDLLGPGWLAVLVFSALAILQGIAIAAIAGRASRALAAQAPGSNARTVAGLAPAVVLLPVGVALAAGAIVVGALPRLLAWLLAARASRTGVIVGRILLGIAVLAALPTFVAAIVSITTSVVR